MNSEFSTLRRRIIFGLGAAPFTAAWRPAWAQADSLASWNDTAPKRAILEFVATVTRQGEPHYVKPEDRIAMFDNDGTLQQPYNLLLKNDLAALTAEDVLQVFADTHTGMTEDEFAADVKQFFAAAKHPKYGVPYTQSARAGIQDLHLFRRRDRVHARRFSGDLRNATASWCSGALRSWE